jgi:hypothetical protein
LPRMLSMISKSKLWTRPPRLCNIYKLVLLLLNWNRDLRRCKPN